MASHTHNVISGPSREELFDALRLASEHRTIKIKWQGLHGVTTSEFLVTDIRVCRELEAELGEDWRVRGHDPNLAGDRGDGVCMPKYNTVTRKGTVVLGL